MKSISRLSFGLWAVLFGIVVAWTAVRAQPSFDELGTIGLQESKQPTGAEGKGDQKTSTVEPVIDPEVKAWFLQKNPPRKPLDPNDVNVLTGKGREETSGPISQGYNFLPPLWNYSAGGRVWQRGGSVWDASNTSRAWDRNFFFVARPSSRFLFGFGSPGFAPFFPGHRFSHVTFFPARRGIHW